MKLLQRSSGCWSCLGWIGWPTEVANDLAGDVALEAADDLGLAFPLGGAAPDVVKGELVRTHADDDHPLYPAHGLVEKVTVS